MLRNIKTFLILLFYNASVIQLGTYFKVLRQDQQNEL